MKKSKITGSASRGLNYHKDRLKKLIDIGAPLEVLEFEKKLIDNHPLTVLRLTRKEKLSRIFKI